MLIVRHNFSEETTHTKPNVKQINEYKQILFADVFIMQKRGSSSTLPTNEWKEKYFGNTLKIIFRYWVCFFRFQSAGTGTYLFGFREWTGKKFKANSKNWNSKKAAAYRFSKHKNSISRKCVMLAVVCKRARVCSFCWRWGFSIGTLALA